MVMLTIMSVCIHPQAMCGIVCPCGNFLVIFLKKRLMSVPCGFHHGVYTNKLNRAGEHMAHDQL